MRARDEWGGLMNGEISSVKFQTRNYSPLCFAARPSRSIFCLDSLHGEALFDRVSFAAAANSHSPW
jgi:hypothetical protein